MCMSTELLIPDILESVSVIVDLDDRIREYAHRYVLGLRYVYDDTLVDRECRLCDITELPGAHRRHDAVIQRTGQDCFSGVPFQTKKLRIRDRACESIYICE